MKRRLWGEKIPRGECRRPRGKSQRGGGLGARGKGYVPGKLTRALKKTAKGIKRVVTRKAILWGRARGEKMRFAKKKKALSGGRGVYFNNERKRRSRPERSA